MTKKRRVKIKRSTSRKTRRIKTRHAPKVKTRIKIKRRKASPRRRIQIAKPRTRKTSHKKIRVRRRKSNRRIARNIGKSLGKTVSSKIEQIKNPEKSVIGIHAQEWLVSFAYAGTGKTIDFIVVALTGKDALKFARREARSTEAGRRMLENFHPRVFQFRPPHYRDAKDIGKVVQR